MLTGDGLRVFLSLVGLHVVFENFALRGLAAAGLDWVFWLYGLDGSRVLLALGGGVSDLAGERAGCYGLCSR